MCNFPGAPVGMWEHFTEKVTVVMVVLAYSGHVESTGQTPLLCRLSDSECKDWEVVVAMNKE